MVLNSYRSKPGRFGLERTGWCQISRLRPTKSDGYVQLSFEGAVHFVVSQWLVLWEAGLSLGPPAEQPLQASHLCNNRRCLASGHVCVEPAQENNRRKGCVVWLPCLAHGRIQLVCPHTPRCVLHCEGFASTADLVENGVCCDHSAYLRARQA